jgi:hypothetical protein
MRRLSTHESFQVPPCSRNVRSNTFWILIACFVAGCATTSPISTPPYYPSNPSAVLLKHQGDVQVTVTASYAGETVTGGYAFAPHFGVLGSGSASLHKAGDPNGSQYSGEIGAGYFDTTTSKHFVAELFGGVGWDGGYNNIVSFDQWVYNTYQKISGDEHIQSLQEWLQAGIGYSRKNNSLMLLLRASYIEPFYDRRYEVVSDPIPMSGAPASWDTTMSRTTAFWSLQPGIEARFGFDHIQLIATLFGTLVNQGNSPSTLLLSAFGVCYKF